MADRARRILIVAGKQLPFVLCLLVCVSYAESAISITLGIVVEYGDYAIPYTPVSFLIASVLEYDLLVVATVLVIGVAIEACRWNIIATLYLFAQLLEKSMFDFDVDESVAVAIAIANIIVSGALVCKGAMIFINGKRNRRSLHN